MNNIISFFVEHKVFTIIMGLFFMFLGVYTHEFSFVYKSIVLGRILPVIFFTIGIGLGKLVIQSQVDNNFATIFFNSLIFVCGVIFLSKTLDMIKITINPLMRSIFLIGTIFLLVKVISKLK